MEKIKNKDIQINRHPTDGFTLSYLTDNNNFFHKRYIGYGIEEAKKLFKQFIHEKEVLYELL